MHEAARWTPIGIAGVQRHWTLVCVVAALALCTTWVRQITDAPIQGDAASTARMAINLAHNGVIGDAPGSPPAPTMYREPVPAVTAALGVILADAFMGRAETDAYLSGTRAKYLKSHHLLWKAGAVCAAYFLTFVLTSSRAAALLAALVVGTHRPNIDNLLTELEAATLLMLGIALLIAGLSRRSLRIVLLAGICFGLLALTKAVFLYVFVGFVLAVPLVLFALRDRGARPTTLATLAVLVIGFGGVTLPWMLRNQLQLGSFQISERGGLTLYIRAVKNEMTWDEYKGSFYAWSPGPLRKLTGLITGFSPTDLDHGGRLQRFNRNMSDDLAAELSGNPAAAISFYRIARAERVRLGARYEAAGHPAPARAADAQLAARAMEALEAHPFRHLATTLPFLWRGAALQIPVFLIALIYSIRARHRGLLLAMIVAIFYIMIHALFTDFEPRYAITTLPLTAVAAIALVAAASLHHRTMPMVRWLKAQAAPGATHDSVPSADVDTRSVSHSTDASIR